MKRIELHPEDYLPASPPQEIVQRYGIAIIGCGNIARNTHLPAYDKFGYRIVAACDVIEEKAQTVAEEYSIPFWTTNIEAIIDRHEVDIIDLAVRPEDRLAAVEQLAPAGKHILSQKPLAPTLAEAERIVDICEEAGITLMINQQARWAPYHTAMKVLIDRGCLGHLYSVLHVHRQFQDGADSAWRTTPDFTIIDNGIHYVDLSRYFTGRTPRRVKTTTTRVPGQNARDPMIYTILCEYEPADLMSTLHFNNIAPALHHSPYLWHIDGTDASASIARHGPLRDGRTELTISFKEDPDQRQVFHIHGSWFPDAWGGTMGEMQRALASGVEPQASGQDNLNSIRITDAAVESSKTGQTVEIPPE